MGPGKEQEGRQHRLCLDLSGAYDLGDLEDENRGIFVGLLPVGFRIRQDAVGGAEVNSNDVLRVTQDYPPSMVPLFHFNFGGCDD